MGRATLVFTFIWLGAVLPLAAQSSQPEPLGDVARQLRQQKSKDTKKPAVVITNDNLPAPVPGEALTILPSNAATPASTSAKSASPAAVAHKDEKDEAAESKTWTREEWQAKFRAARRDLAKAKEVEQLSEDELNLMQIQEARELDAVAKQGLDTHIQNKQSEVNVDKATTADAQKALDHLEELFQQSGAPDDWSVTDEPKESGS